jgi:hypothetical protein
VRTAAEALQDARNTIDGLKQALPKIVSAVAARQTRELFSMLGARTRKLTRREQDELHQRLVRLQTSLSPYHVALLALSGQLHPTAARYFLLEQTISALLRAGGVRVSKNADALDVLLQHGAKGLKESSLLRRQPAYQNVGAWRNDLIGHLTTAPHQNVLQEVLDQWYDSSECRKVIHYAQQYGTRAAHFVHARPTRYTQRSLLRLVEQYRVHAILLGHQLQLLLALELSASGERHCHSDIQEKNFASLLGSAKVHQALQGLAGALDRHVRNALAHGVPEINWDRRTCMFRDRDQQVELTFNEFFDKTMGLTVTAVCLLGIDQRIQHEWVRQRVNDLLRAW